MNKKTIFIGLTILAALICLFGISAIGGAYFFILQREATGPSLSSEVSFPPTATVVPTATSAPDVAIKPDRAPINPPSVLMDTATETEIQLSESILPVRDLRELASRLKYGGRELPAVVNLEPPTYNVGDQDDFWIVDNTSQPPRQFQVSATLQHITEHGYWWVEDGFIVSQRDLEQSGNVFETKIYPTNHNFFGTEWIPGVDNDPHVSIFLGNVPGVGGYYASSHEFSKEVDDHSNEREMFLINLNALKPGNSAFDGVLAHEFQHMIHWHQDRNESTWVNEGMSELAVLLNGLGQNRAQDSYLQNPDLQLTTWAQGLANTAPHYGSSYLFMAYFLDQFGEDAMKAVVSEQGNSVRGFDNVLANFGETKRFDDVFADFVIANYLDDPSLADGQWGYDSLNLNPVKITTEHRNFPVTANETVHQYGVDYISVRGNGPLTVNFSGSTSIPLINNQARSGQYQWYSNRGDDSNATLTRDVDLSGVTSATLNYSVWYDIEEDWDYAYVEVSTDGGQSWVILDTPSGRTTNPTGNAYGTGYTATSGGWLDESVDLSAYAGQKILLRYEYITDDATNGPGFALDDIAIPEIGFSDDTETLDAGWDTAGFIRMDNVLRQRFVVQVIDQHTGTTVSQMPLDSSNIGTLTLGEAGEAVDVILVISALAPVTTERATYQYTIE